MLKPLLLLAGMLAATIALELRPAPAPHLPAPVAPSPHRSNSAPAAVPVAPALSLVLDRPLFAPGRRPPRTLPAGDALPRLSGIVHGPSLSLAIFDAQREGGRSSLLPVGAELAGWRIARIDPSQVMLRRGDAVLELRPRYKASRPPPPPPVDMASIVVLSSKHTNPQLAW